MSDALATVAFVPRETVSRTLDSLASILAHTPKPYDLLLVIACYPEAIRAELRSIGAREGATVVELPGFVTPNEARNAALAKVDTPYVVFIDNDAEVRDDWLTPLVDAITASGAAIVGPLVFELYPPFTRIHMAGGTAALIPKRNGFYDIREWHHDGHKELTEAMAYTEPRETGLLEFHAVMVEADWLRGRGGLDTELCCVSEHWDMCLQATADGRKILLVPASKVNYSPPRRPTPDDLRFYDLRWSRAWFEHGARRMMEKYKVRRKSAYGGWPWVIEHRTHTDVPMLRQRLPFLNYKWAKRISRWITVPLSDVFPPRQRLKDIADWERRRGSIS